MTIAPLRCCVEPGCPRLVSSGRCAEHHHGKRQHERRFTSKAQQFDGGDRYLPPVNYGRRWQRAAHAHLATHPYCVDCQAEGNAYGLASEVDHEEPHRGDPVLFWDDTNWRSRCKTHHSRKTAREVGLGSTGG